MNLNSQQYGPSGKIPDVEWAEKHLMNGDLRASAVNYLGGCTK